MDNDIVLLLYRLKVNIRKVEAGDRECLPVIESDFYELMELLKLFLISERETYYGYFLMNMSYKVDFKAETIAGIALNEYPPVFCSNPLLFCKFSLKEIIFIVCHEIEHVILNHPAEMLKANPTKNSDLFMRFNYAADASVNDRLISDISKNRIKYMSFPSGCIDSKTFADTFELKHVRSNESYKYYYNLIKDSIDPEEDSMSNALQQAVVADAEQSGESGESSDGSQVTGADNSGNTDNNNSQLDDGIVTSQNVVNISDHNWEAGTDAEAASEITKEFINDAVEMMSSETRGNMPSSFMSIVKKINEPAKIPWEKILKKYVGTISAGYRKTRTRLNRRQPERFDISGKMEEKTLKIVVAIDTSASVGDDDISHIFNEIFAILSKKKFELTVVECDAAIQRVYKATSREDIKTSVRGRGGTAFTPVIDYINKDKYFRDSLLIYFTDGYGEYSIPKPKTYRNMWVIIDGAENLSLNEPYGLVVGM